jgi:hypothetical protein
MAQPTGTLDFVPPVGSDARVLSGYALAAKLSLTHASRRVGTRQTESLRHRGAATRRCCVGTRADTRHVGNFGKFEDQAAWYEA